MSLNYSYDSSMSFDDFVEETNDSGIQNIDINNQMEEHEWHWDSSRFWLVVLIIILSLLIIVNLFMYNRFVRAVKESLGDMLNDSIFWAFGLYVAYRKRQSEKAAEALSASNMTISLLEPIDGFRPSPYCCFRDQTHAESETQSSDWDKPDLIIEEGKRHKVLVNVLGGKQINFNHNQLQAEGKGKDVNREQKDFSIDDGYLRNLNVNENGEKDFKKTNLSTVTEEQGTSKVEKPQLEDVNAENEIPDTIVGKPLRKVANCCKTHDSEIFI